MDKLSSAHSCGFKCKKCGTVGAILTLTKGNQIVQKFKCYNCGYEKSRLNLDVLRSDDSDSIWITCRDIMTRKTDGLVDPHDLILDSRYL